MTYDRRASSGSMSLSMITGAWFKDAVKVFVTEILAKAKLKRGDTDVKLHVQDNGAEIDINTVLPGGKPAIVHIEWFLSSGLELDTPVSVEMEGKKASKDWRFSGNQEPAAMGVAIGLWLGQQGYAR